jgi:hypothetical protein
MPRKSRVGPARGLYAGLTLAEWRGSVRALLRSCWWIFAVGPVQDPSATELHHAVVQSSLLLLPPGWHREHAGRFTAEWYAGRRAAVNQRAYRARAYLLPERHEA